MQQVLAGEWKQDLEFKQIGFQDATCYETSMCYPTDVKILFESMEYLEEYMRELCKYYGIRIPRNKFKEQKTKL